MRHAIGATLLLAMLAIPFALTVHSEGWRGAAVVWGGAGAMTAGIVFALHLLSS